MEESAKNFSFQPDVEYTGASGRPKIRVIKERLTCRLDNGFKGTDMTCMLSISRATLNRRRKNFNLEISHSFSTIDDDTLDGIVRSKKEEFPNSGYRMVWGHLKGRGLVIQQSRVRESRCRESNALRWLHVTERRKYKVASPNALLAYRWTLQTQKVSFAKLCISRVCSHLCLFSYLLSDCCCWHLFVYQELMNWIGILDISFTGVNWRLWCSHSVFTGHPRCSALSNNILAGEIKGKCSFLSFVVRTSHKWPRLVIYRDHIFWWHF